MENLKVYSNPSMPFRFTCTELLIKKIISTTQWEKADFRSIKFIFKFELKLYFEINTFANLSSRQI